MKSLMSWLLVFAAIGFWIFRMIIAFTYSATINFPFTPLNLNIEIALLFTTLILMIFIIKRKIIGVLLYLATYWYYFGMNLYNGIIDIGNNTNVISNYTNLFVSFIGVLIPFIMLIDILFNKGGAGSGAANKKTGWFYDNEEFDRKIDDRADKNNYRTM